MSIKAAIDALQAGKLDAMKQQFSSTLTEKAINKLEEKKIQVAKNYLGTKK